MDAEALERRRVQFERLANLFSYVGGSLIFLTLAGGLFVSFLNINQPPGTYFFILGAVIWALSFFTEEQLDKVIRKQRAKMPLAPDLMRELEILQNKFKGLGERLNWEANRFGTGKYRDLLNDIMRSPYMESRIAEINKDPELQVWAEKIICSHMEVLEETVDWWKSNKDRPMFTDKSQS